MRYAKIDTYETCNGAGNGISLFAQGCRFRCNDCFNQETWDFNSGQEWTEEIEKEFLELVNRPHIKRISILGGDPLAEENLKSVLELLKKIRILFGDTKTIWLYTGYKIEYLLKDPLRKEIVKLCDIVVDGRFEADKKDLSLPFRGSKNQRIIDIQRTMSEESIVIYDLHSEKGVTI